MKIRTLRITVIVCLMPLFGISQTKNTAFEKNDTTFRIDFIKDFRIKIDGGCSFYTFDSIPVSKGRFIMVISAKQVAFISLQGEHEYVYLQPSKKTELSNGLHRSVFSGQGYTAILLAKKVNKLSEHSSLYKGTLEIKYNKHSQIYPVHGKVDR